MKARYETQESTFKWYFEQNGSAYKIQTWFRNLPWYVKAKFNRVYLPYYKQRKTVWMNSARASKRAKRRKKKRKAGMTAKDLEYQKETIPLDIERRGVELTKRLEDFQKLFEEERQSRLVREVQHV